MKKKLVLSFLIIVLLFAAVSCDFKKQSDNEYKNLNEVIDSMKGIIKGLNNSSFLLTSIKKGDTISLY